MKFEKKEFNNLEEVMEAIKGDLQEGMDKMQEKKDCIQEIMKKLEEIKVWNAETFTTSPLHGQLAKLEEEMAEFDTAVTNKEDDKAMMEMADVFIVLGGLMRWESRIGAMVLNCYLEDMPLCVMKQLIEAIDKKMEINRERTAKGVWKVQPDGSSHH